MRNEILTVLGAILLVGLLALLGDGGFLWMGGVILLGEALWILIRYVQGTLGSQSETD